MNFALAKRNALQVTASRLELEYADWPGSWDEFIAAIKERGDKDELQVLDLYPREFRQHAETRRLRVQRWEDNRLLGLLDNMHSLAVGAEKSNGKGMVADNRVRLDATKFLLERVFKHAPKKTPGDVEDKVEGQNIDEMKARQEELDRQLKERGVSAIKETTTTVERSIEIDGPAPE